VHLTQLLGSNVEGVIGHHEAGVKVAGMTYGTNSVCTEADTAGDRFGRACQK
jgi:hypothetical protein